MVRSRHPAVGASRDSHTAVGPSFAPISQLYGSFMDLESVGNQDISPGVIDDSKIVPGGLDGSAVLTPGTVDLTPFASNLRPIVLVDTLPPLPDNLYPIGAFIYKTTDVPPRLYKNVADVWSSAIGPNDIEANSITAGQISAGAIGVSELDARAVTADKLAVGLVGSRNLFQNGGFRNGLAGWTFNQNTDTTSTVQLWPTSDTSWTLRDGDIDGYNPSTGPFGSTVAIKSEATTTKEPYLYQTVPVVAGETYSMSVLMGQHRSTWVSAVIWWLQGDGTYISGSYSSTYTGYHSGGPWRSGWERMAIENVVAPALAQQATIAFILRTPYTSLADCYLFLDQAWFGSGAYARDFDPQEASRVRNSDGNVVIDSSGITVTNGKISIIDSAGSTVMSSAGFAGAWNDFVRNGLYNGTFAGGTAGACTGTVGAAAGNRIPYWGWTVPGSGATLTHVPSTSSSEVYLSTASVDLDMMSTVVPCRSMGRYQARIRFRFHGDTGGATLGSCTPTVYWYDYAGSYLTNTACTPFSSNSPYVDGEHLAEPVVAPNGAFFMSLQLRFRKVSGTPNCQFDTLQAGLVEAIANDQSGAELLVGSVTASENVYAANIKYGTSTQVGNGTATAHQDVTFSDAWPSWVTPVVIATINSDTDNYIVTVHACAYTGFSWRTSRKDGATFTSSTTVTINWFAYA